MRRAFLLAPLILALAAPVAQAAAPRLTNCDGRTSAIRPATVILTCADAGFVANQLTWSNWGTAAAKATGRSTIKTCDPNCAEGGREDYPVVLTADRLATCRDGSRRYTRVRYSFPLGSPFPNGSPGAEDASVTFRCPAPRPTAGRAVKKCGNYGFTTGQTSNRPRFTDEQIDGAGSYDIVAVVSSCTMARRLVSITSRSQDNPCYPGREINPCRVLGFVCRVTLTGYESSRTRCTSNGGRIVRWDSGA